VWYDQVKQISIGNHQVKDVMSLKSALGQHQALSFVDLTITNKNGQKVSHNFYWLAPNNKFETLSSLPETKVKVWVQKVARANVPTWRVHITNPTNKLAFFIRTQLMSHHGTKEVLPSFWSGNYVNLAPHQSVTLTVSSHSVKKGKTADDIKISGWNIPAQSKGLE
jgi:hypothetical protein